MFEEHAHHFSALVISGEGEQSSALLSEGTVERVLAGALEQVVHDLVVVVLNRVEES